jgi:hypothetical protein
MRLTVACVLWVGEFEGRHYSPAWVHRLRDQVAAHLPLPHRFVCLSNTEVPGVEVLPLTTGWPGWWAKVEVFNPANDLGTRVLYLDLDVFVTGDLTPLARFPFPLALMPPSHVFGGLRPRNMPGVVRRYQASVIAFDPPHGRDLFEKCGPGPMGEFRSDQDWIGHVRPSCPTFPAAWFAKAKQCRHGVPPEVRVVLAHRANLLGRTLEEVAVA